jgi:protein xylosyltransferase
VGTDYDQKEQIFRNFAGSIGPQSEPTLAYHVYSSEPLNITFVWVNPSHSVQAVNNYSVSGGETVRLAVKVYFLIFFNLYYLLVYSIERDNKILYSSFQANFVKPSLKMPLLPGNWTVKILSEEGSLIAHTKFLVIPILLHQSPSEAQGTSREM